MSVGAAVRQLERRSPNSDLGELGLVAQYCDNPASSLPSVVRVIEMVEARQRFPLPHWVIEDVGEMDAMVP